MAITFLEKRKQLKYLASILVILVLVLIFVFWYSFLRAPAVDPEKVIPEVPRPEMPKIRFETLRDPLLRQLKRFEQIPDLGEVLTIGEAYTIRWETYPFDFGEEVRIYLIKKDYQAFIAEAQNIGFYEWHVKYVYLVENVKKPILPGRYKIKIITSEDNRLLVDKSDDYFSIIRLDVEPNPWDWNYCTLERPCAIGKGNCEIDTDCQPGLFCAHNVGADYDRAYDINVCRKIPEEVIILLFPDEAGIGRENPFMPYNDQLMNDY